MATATFSKEQLLAAMTQAKNSIERSPKDTYSVEEFAELMSKNATKGERFIVPLIIIVAILLYSQEAN